MYASSDKDTKARIGKNFYDSLEDAIMNASSTDIINLTNDITLDNTLDIKKTYFSKFFLIFSISLSLNTKLNLSNTNSHLKYLFYRVFFLGKITLLTKGITPSFI